MSPTHEQIVQEAERRQFAANNAGIESTHDGDYGILSTIIEVVREGWKPPEPVDPDVLAFWEWADNRYPGPEKRQPRNTKKNRQPGAAGVGGRDKGSLLDAYRAGARMARERERERAKVLMEYVKALSVRFGDNRGRARDILAKYEEGLK